MIDRFSKFTDEELHELRDLLQRHEERPYFGVLSTAGEIRASLLSEIEHVQVQREHRLHREALPA